MNQPIDLDAITARLNEAFVELGFKLNDRRHDAFWHLCIQYSKYEGGRVWRQSRRQNLFLSVQDIMEYTAVTFIQRYGNQIWPADKSRRGHLEDSYDWLGTFMEWNSPLNADVHQNCQSPGNHDRTLYQEKLRSPLGSKVRKYFEILFQVPGILLPDFGSPSLAGIENHIRLVLDTSRG